MYTYIYICISNIVDWFTCKTICRMLLDLQLRPLICLLRAAKRFPELGGWTAITISRREMTAFFGLG